MPTRRSCPAATAVRRRHCPLAARASVDSGLIKKPAGFATGGLFLWQAYARGLRLRSGGTGFGYKSPFALSEVEVHAPPLYSSNRAHAPHQNRNAAVARKLCQRNLSSDRRISVPVVFGASTNGLVAGAVP